MNRTFFVLVAVLCAAPARAAVVPAGFADRTVATGLTSPTAMAILPDGRLLVTQQNGRVRLIKNDALSPTDFYFVSGVDDYYERGLLGVVADPAFTQNGHVYLYYTALQPSPHQRIIRVTASGDGVMPGSERVILDMPNVPAGVKWHMGGPMRFGPDGKLYVGVGNQEDERRTDSNSAKLSNPFGKILRLNPDGTVPADNPFYNTAGAYRAIWAYGLRNPFTFDIAPSGLMYINDVGQSTWEEVNRGAPGANYGWPATEGATGDPRYTTPAYTYIQSPECAVVGAAFYEPPVQQFPAAYVGKYFFGDFCAGWIKRLDPATRTVTSFVTGLTRLVNIGVSPDGSLYYLDRNQHTGTPTEGRAKVGKITYTGSQAPRITQHPQDQTVYVGEPATFTVAALDATSYQWQRNGVDITGATSTTYRIAAAALGDDGARFRAIARNSFGSATSGDAALTVTTNRPPTGTILTPPAGKTYDAGETIAFSGSATDPEDGTIPPSGYTWAVDIQHDTHSHAFVPPASGTTNGSFTVSAEHNTSANIWYRLWLVITDSGQRTHSSFRDLRPRTAISDMSWVGTPVNGWGPVEKDLSNGEMAAGDGRTITLGGIPYAKGLGVHAPSEVVYALGGTCSGAFISDVGVDDEVTAGSVVFQVWLDGVKAFDSGIMRGADLRKPVNVGVTGVSELRLVVTDAGDGKASDHADWAGARVSGCGTNGAPTPTPTATPTPTPTPPSGGLVEITPPASAVSASMHDGNLPANTVDNNLATRWSANGDGAWIEYDLGSVRTVAQVGIAVYNGNARRNRFDLRLSSDGAAWTTVWSGESSGTTTAEQPYDIADAPARWVRYVGHGSSVGTYNSLTEVSLFAPAGPTPTPTTPTPTATPTPTPTPTVPSGELIEVTPPTSGVTAGAHDGNLPANTVDGSLATRWSANGDGQWIQYDVGTVRRVAQVRVAVYNGNARRNRFDLELSLDGTTWTGVWSGESSGTTTAEETYEFADADARFVRYVGHGASVTTFNSVTEVSIFAASAASTPTPVPTVVSFRPEAEAGSPTSPLQVLSDTAASGGRYVEVAPGTNSTAAPPTTGRATFTFSLVDSGTFKVWGRVITPTTGDDSFWVQMNGGTWVNWNNIAPGSAWHWDDVHDAASGNTPVTWFLAPGTHTLTVAYREDGARLDRLVITNDLASVPGGTGD